MFTFSHFLISIEIENKINNDFGGSMSDNNDDKEMSPMKAMLTAEAYNWAAWVIGAMLFLVAPYLIIPVIIYAVFSMFDKH